MLLNLLAKRCPYPSMTSVLRIGDHSFACAELLPLLSRHRLLPQLVRELLIDQAIANIAYTAEEQAAACQQFLEQHQLKAEAEYQNWLKHHSLSPKDWQTLVTRSLMVEKFKQKTWGHRLESSFISHKAKFDKIIYSLIRTQDMALAQELFFRIQAGEQAFADLAREYSQGPEAQTGGLIGPVALTQPHPALAQKLSTARSGQLCPPMPLENWVVIVRLESFISAQLDDVRQQLLNDLFEAWLQQEIEAKPWSIETASVSMPPLALVTP